MTAMLCNRGIHVDRLPSLVHVGCRFLIYVEHDEAAPSFEDVYACEVTIHRKAVPPIPKKGGK